MHLPRFSFSSDGLLDMVLWSYPEAANPSAEVVVVVESAEVAASLVWGVFEPELQGTLRCMTHMSALSKKLVSPERHDECHGERGGDKAANDCAGVVTRRRRQLRFAVHYNSVAHFGSI